MNDHESEKKKGLLSNLFGGKTKDKQQQPPLTDASTITKNDVVETSPPAATRAATSKKPSNNGKITEELLHQKEQLEHERTLERRVIQEKTQKIHVTMELNAQMEKELGAKDEAIRLLETKNTVLTKALDAKVDELEVLKQKLSLLEEELSIKNSEEKKLVDEKKELMANINLHGWLCKRGIKGPTADVWRKRYFKVEEGNKLMYYKRAADGLPQGYIDIDRIVLVKAISGGQKDNVFHVVTEGRTYELLAHDEASMNKWMSSLQYMKEWRAKQKREANY